MLNIEQAKAVNKIDGPVMVIAGPGTGKTQILANRIAKILELTDSHAQNILCLTYTDAGTVAMKKRLLQFIGGDAHRVSVHTFHSFCSRIIQENPEEFQYRNLQPISELERIELLNEMTLNLAEIHVLKKMKGNVGYVVGQLSRLFSWMKKENYSAETLEELANKYLIEELESEELRYKRKYKNFEKGDLKPHLVEKLKKSIEEFVAAAHLFSNYQQKMEELNRYDFDDMILWVLGLFKESDYVLNNYRELFHYILVDEFQDTSGAQNAIVEYLISYWENPNIFVVGDDDQSIYRFQGAEVKNVVDFAHQYQKHLYPIILTTNYRSTQYILDAAKVHIEQNEERLVNLLGNLDKKLIASDPNNVGNPVELWSFNSSFNESYWLFNAIKSKIDAGTNPQEIAVIYRNHRHAEELAKLLAHQKIPIYFHRRENALHSIPVQKILTILKYVQAEISFPYSGEEFLFELMHEPAFGLSPLICARVSHHIFYKRIKWRDFMSEILHEKHNDFDVDRIDKKSIHTFGEILENLLAEVHKKSLMAFVDSVLQSFNITENHLFNAFDIECIKTFVNFVQTECQNQPSLTIKQLLDKLDLMESYHISLSKEHVLYNSNGVQFMTAHASKGLEFEHVYIINCSQKAWDSDNSGNRPYGFINIFNQNELSASLEENRRLFYVAMTRAKKSLTLSHHIFDSKGKDVIRSSYLDTLSRAKIVSENEGPQDSEDAIKILNAITFSPNLLKKDLLDATIIDRYLATYQLSPSHLNAYLTCPTAFYFEQILRVPSAKSKYMSFGTAVHKSLDQLFKLKSSQPELFNASHLRELYQQNLLREKYVFANKEFEDFLSLGLNVLSEYFSTRSTYWLERKEILTEVTIDRIEIEGVPVKGQLDLLDIDGNSVQVVDFKTGDATKSGPRLKPPKEGATEDDSIEAKHGGPYWRQMMFYALLIKHNTSKPLNMVSGTFEFVEPDAQNTFQRHQIFIDSEGLNHVQNLIKSVYDRITSREFINGCNLETCRWCSFVSKNGNNSINDRLSL